MKKILPADRQAMFCDFVAHVCDVGDRANGRNDRILSYVYDFLADVTDVSRRGWRAYEAAHHADLVLHEPKYKAILEFLAFRGITAGRVAPLSARTELDGKAREILNGFAAYVSQKGYSPATTKGYITGVRDFLRYSVKLTSMTAQGYVKTLEERHVAARTLNARVNALMCLAGFLKVTIGVRKVKIPHTLSLENVPTEAEIRKVLDYCREHNERYYIFIRLLTTTGARVHEFMKITFEMVATGSAVIRGKGNKERRFFFTDQVRREVADYACRHDAHGIIATDHRGHPLTSYSGINATLKIIADRAGVPREKMHCHAFRHYFAKMYLKHSKRKDVSELADLMGHSGLNTTMIYLQRSEQEQRRIFRNTVTW